MLLVEKLYLCMLCATVTFVKHVGLDVVISC